MAADVCVRPTIGIGYRTGKLTVTEPTSQRKNGYTVWKCRCDCGGEICLDTRCLQRQTIADCGCGKNVKPGQKDLCGQRFGKLVCLTPTDRRSSSGSILWLCQCDCGNTCTAASTQLTAGYRKSCGCLSKPPLKNLVGNRFGKLTVTAYAGKRSGMHRWTCICDCGRETVVGQTLLQKKKTKSCGCLQSSTITENLKLCSGTSVTRLEIAKSKRISTNTSGRTGVYLKKKTGKWIAQITFKSKTYYLGSFDSFDDAVAARNDAEKMFDDFLNWYYASHSSISPSTEEK